MTIHEPWHDGRPESNLLPESCPACEESLHCAIDADKDEQGEPRWYCPECGWEGEID